MSSKSDKAKPANGAKAIRKAEQELADDTPRRSWRDYLKVHPVIAELPTMTAEELEALATDIKTKGLQTLILTCSRPGDKQRYLLDGRNRSDACELLGWQIVDAKGNWCGYIVPCTKFLGTLDEAEALAVVQTVNFRRKHYTPEQIKAAHRLLVPRMQKQLTEPGGEDTEVIQSQMRLNSPGRPTEHKKEAVKLVAAMTGAHPSTVYRHLHQINDGEPATSLETEPDNNEAPLIEARFREAGIKIRKLITKAIANKKWTYRNRAKACAHAGRLLKKLEQEFASAADERRMDGE
jgi:hypothetical protein